MRSIPWLAVFWFSLAALPAVAQLNTWQGPAVGAWDAPENWSAGSPPGPGHYVLITPDAGATVTGSALPASIELLGVHAPVSGTTTLELAADLAIAQKLLIASAGVVDVGGHAITAADAIVAGRLLLDDGALVDSTAGILNAGSIEITPGAAVHLAGGPITNVGTLSTDFVGYPTTKIQVDGDFVNAGKLQLPGDLEIGGRFIQLGAADENFYSTNVSTPDLCANLGTLEMDIFGGMTCGVFYNAGSIFHGGIVAATVVNEGIFLGDDSGIRGSVLNRGTLGVASVRGDVQNELGAKFQLGSVTGLLHSDGAVEVGQYARANDIELTATASFESFVDSYAFTIQGDFLNSMTQATSFVARLPDMRFAGGDGVHRLRHPGADLGPVAAGYVANFSIPRVTLASGESLVLEDGNATPGVGLYVRSLVLEGGVAQIASITGNGANIYYDPARAENAYLGGVSHPLAGGGSITPVP